MELQALFYVLTDLLRRVRRSAVPVLLSTLSLACSLFFLAGFHLFHSCAESFIAEAGTTPRLSVFIHHGSSIEEQESILSEIRRWPETRGVKISRRLPPVKDRRESMGLLDEAFEGLWIESAGTRIEILLASDISPAPSIDGMLERLRRFENIMGVLDDRARLERLEPLHGFLISLESWTVGLLAFLCILISVACSVLTLKCDAEEIEVCLLLGGSRLQVFLPLYGRAILVGLAAGTISAVGVLILLGRVRWLLPGMTLMTAEWAHWESALLFSGMVTSGALLSCLGCWCSLWYPKHCGAISAPIDSRQSCPATGHVGGRR